MRELWLQVLRAGLEDAQHGVEARWIGSRGFQEVCDLAGLEPDRVESHFLSILGGQESEVPNAASA